MGVAHANRAQGFRIIAFVTIGVTLYELAQPILPRGVLNWKDVICTPIAGLISLGLLLLKRRVILVASLHGEGARP